ncbi:hypothetical protein O3P69_014846 [Scylla paramamosain]|uniref:Uncharacterized protein n=1 Tax=Scylla paramamosain TaxID=85552 RepID=A0AAW0TZG2_SCYPA
MNTDQCCLTRGMKASVFYEANSVLTKGHSTHIPYPPAVLLVIPPACASEQLSGSAGRVTWGHTIQP